MHPILFVPFFIVTYISTINAVDISTLPQLVDDEDCCNLELKNVINYGKKKFIPSSAIPALTRNGLDTYFFITNIPAGDPTHYTYVGAINNTAGGPAFKWARYVKYYNWTEGAVLANPNDCVLGWNASRLPLAETNKFSYPKLSSAKGIHYFGRSGSFIGETHAKGYHLNGVDMVNEELDNFDEAELLYVDCAASLKNQLSSELFNIDLGNNGLNKGNEDEEEVVSSTDVTNNSDEDQMMKVDLDAEIFSSLEMTQESKLFEFSQTKWGVHSDSSKLGWFNKILNLNGGYDSDKVKKNFTKTGSVSIQSKRTLYKLNQEIKVKAKTQTKVFIKTKPIRANMPFMAFYKLTPRTSMDMWTNKRMLNSIVRTGFEDWDKITVQNGSLIVPVSGHLSVESGFETKAEIISTPLNSNLPKEVFKKILTPTR